MEIEKVHGNDMKVRGNAVEVAWKFHGSCEKGLQVIERSLEVSFKWV
jgi:hypothetical protein